MQRYLFKRVRGICNLKWVALTLIVIAISVIQPALSQTHRQELPLKDLASFQGEFGAADFDSVGLDSFIVDYMTSHHIPGLSAVIIKDNDFIYSGEFGNAYFSPQVLVSDSTLFMLASISKTVTATALMQLYDQGYFNLDDPINNYLPFQVNHPNYPSTLITFRMLLTHTSGIRDNWFVMDYYPGDSPIPLGEYLSNYLVPGGAYYYAGLNFTPWAPGDQFEYCNNALALVGYLVEVISGQDFSQYCQSNVFPVVDMYESSFRFADLDSMRIAQPMSWNGNSYTTYTHYGYSDYPSGSLRTSAIQLARFLSSYMNDGQYGVNTLLDSSTVAEMLSPQIPQIDPSQGLIWYFMYLGGRQIWGHGGGDLGVTTEMYFCPDQNSGVVLLTNGEAYFYDILDACFDYAQSYNVYASLDLTPHDPPIIIPASGGNFQFDAAIANLDEIPILFDFWIDVITPSGATVGPLLLRQNLQLPFGQTILRENVTQTVPATAPSGTYQYVARLGQYPGNAIVTDQFEFSKNGASSDFAHSSNWSISGWDDNALSHSSQTPDEIKLSAFPNPFNPETTLTFSIPRSDWVTLTVFDLTGRQVAKLVDGWCLTGTYETDFDGEFLPSGMYFAQFKAGSSVESRKLLLLK